MVVPRRPAEDRPPLWKIMWVTARPHTLTAAIAPCLVGYSVTYHHLQSQQKLLQDNTPSLTTTTLLWTIFCMLIQLGTNVHNDYADFVKGADTEARVGQARATQKGWLTPTQTATGATLVLVMALGVGIILGYPLLNSQNAAIFFGLVVLSSIFNAFAYTGGPYPLGYLGLPATFSIGYSGLGDVFVFVYFGGVATTMIPYLYTNYSNSHDMSLLRQPLLWSAAAQVGCLATNILVVNNLRDRITDVSAGKRTLAVRMGPTFCRIQYTLLCGMAYLLALLDTHVDASNDGSRNFLRLLPLLSLPLARQEIRSIWTTDGRALNPHVGKAALLELVFCILTSAALCWTR